jgi:drug/metabolite transporter (DMT)-like permease
MSVDIVATRSAAVVSLAVALMALVAALVLVTIGVVVQSIRDPRTPDFAIVASLVALLFAIPALRSSLPEAPPPGTLTDFVVFLWALVVVGVLMVALSLVYIRRYGRR